MMVSFTKTKMKPVTDGVVTIAHHTEETVVQALHRLSAAAAVCRVAVAYCGKDSHFFFPEAPSKWPEDLRIVVDASESAVRRGLTNPQGLNHLLGMTSQVKSLEGLHAKVFIFDERVALVGSANMSAGSIRHQFQLGLEVCNGGIVKKLIDWFDEEIWKKVAARKLDDRAVRKLMRLWPNRNVVTPHVRTKAKLPSWRGEAPQPATGPSEFKIGVSSAELRRLLGEFRNNQCGYDTNGKSCLDVARDAEAHYTQLSRDIRSLWRRRASWGKADLETLFDLAYTNGKAAKLRKPEFARQNPARVVRSLDFLLEGAGDPFIRFEKVLAKGSQHKLHGMGEVGIIFLMHLWEPKKFAVVNEPVEKALKALKVSFGATSQRKGQAFKERNAAVERLANRTGLKTFGLVDHFLDAIGKGHIGPPRG